MELDFIKEINEFGDSVVRLYNFDKLEAKKLKDVIEDRIINEREKLDLSSLDFIEPRNCNLILALYKEDEGIITNDDQTFYCALTLGAFYDLLDLIEPFSQKESKAHQYLYDLDNPIDFLFSPAGSW